MNKLLQINSVCNIGSTGKIAEEIGIVAMKNNWESHIAYARGAKKSESHTTRIANKLEVYSNVLYTRIFDKDSPISKIATKRLIKYIESISPDIIHLHNLHGYYLNVPYFFDFLTEIKRPVVWTLHDCWSFTGHCAHFGDCEKWKTKCDKCKLKTKYPKSILFDNSKNNYLVKQKFAEKAESFLHLVPVSDWISNFLESSIYKNCKKTTIRNGIDLSKFYPKTDKKDIEKKYNLDLSNYIIAVSYQWSAGKGYFDLFNIYELIKSKTKLLVVGVNKKQQKELQDAGIMAIQRTSNQDDLSILYSNARAFINPTYNDTYPTVNLESIACGTPVITYNTGGSPESIIKDKTGFVVEQADIPKMAEFINIILNSEEKYKKFCIEESKVFDKYTQFQKYINLYDSILKKEK